MSSALKAIEKDRTALLKICRQLDDSAWLLDSGCPGWSVQDVVSHMACSFWLAVDPSTLPGAGEVPGAGELPGSGGLPAERAADRYVEARRSMTPEQVVADYESVSLRGLEALAEVAAQDLDIPLGDVGTYPASAMPSVFAFEAFVHIRYDLFPPGGPLAGKPPEADELLLGPTLDWIEVALPQQNAGLLGGVRGAIEIDLDGLCPRKLRVGEGDAAARVTSDSQAFVRWITQRSNWEELGVRAEGDPAALGIIRRLRVF
ncbi:MAG TPA: maleylpyruvate isomerase family mycothiol-dependent enzyme [Pseudonocardia sp.]|jgi:uncharacterized protein (TIGR03083 family)|nr:maleylpyruvate isomerase family mycothiol-dependent enzyme [Pseudonocardia sp.]